MKSKLAVAVALIMLGSIASAHDVIITAAPKGSAALVRYGHPKDWRPVDIEKMVTFSGIDANGQTMDLKKDLSPSGIDLKYRYGQLAPAMLEAKYDNGYWVSSQPSSDKDPTWLNASRLMVTDGKQTMISLKFAKMLIGSGANPLFSRELKHTLELIPQKDPASLEPGESLPVLVKFNGMPLANAGIENSDTVTAVKEDQIPRYRTDKQGIAQVPLHARGANILVVDYQVLKGAVPGLSDAGLAVDKVMFVASLSVSRPR